MVIIKFINRKNYSDLTMNTGIQKNLENYVKLQWGQSPSSSNYTENELDTVLIQGNTDLINGKVVPRVYTTGVTKTC